jgi:hypothetical protein
LKAHVPKLVDTFNKLDNANREIEVLKKNLENNTQVFDEKLNGVEQEIAKI